MHWLFKSTVVLALSASVHAYTPTINNSSAPDAQTVCPGYTATNVQQNGNGLTATLTLAGSACNAYGSDIPSLALTVEYQDSHRLNVNIEPTYMGSNNITYYVLDDDLVTRPSGSVASSSSDFQFSWGNSPSFYFKITRQSTGDVIFDTSGNKLVFENQFIELVNNLPSGYSISGLGEHIHQLALTPGWVSTNWNVDSADTVDTNLYGSHPFYLETRYINGQDANNHGVYYRNAHGSEVVFNDNNLIWRFIGGSVDLYFFDGPSALEVTQQYTSAIGLPAMQQYWTLGFHQCAWGYQDWTQIIDSINNYSAANVPLETQWIDIDYMWGYRDFTIDQIRFRDDYTNKTLDQLHNNHQHFVPIVDAAIKYEPNDTDYGSYGVGADLDVYLKNPDGTYFVGQVWPGDAVWVDWHHPSSSKFWSDQLVGFHKEMQFDGIWLDMNEASNFCSGSCGTSPPPAGPLQPGERDINNPPYAINSVSGSLTSRTISPNVTHYDGVVEYDVHNLFGYQEMNATYNALLNTFPGDRPFIIGRSTFVGAGQWGGHWGGDNQATWESMAASIPQGLTFSLFGIPMFGPDTCGFSGTTTEELCGRWMQLSAFYPFYRNHYEAGALPHEAWRWPSVAQWSAEIMQIRYSMFPYMYTLLYQAATTGSTVLRALSWEFPQDPSLFGIDTQFLLGPALMVVPVLQQGATSVSAIFPGSGPWYDWYQQNAVSVSSGGSLTVDAPQGTLPLYVRGGNILAQQAPGYTAYESRQGQWTLLVALDANGAAEGSIYLDDGHSLSPSQTQTVTLAVSGKSLTATSTGSYDFSDYGVSPPPLLNIIIMGLQSFGGGQAQFNGVSVGTLYDSNNKKLVVQNGLSDQTSNGAFSENWTLTWD